MRLLVISLSALGILALAACSGTTAQSALAIVQAEAKTVDTAVDALAPALIASQPVANQAALKADVANLDKATVVLENVALGQSTAVGYVETFLTTAEQAVAILPLPQPTVVAIDTGLALADAFVQGLPVNVPAATLNVSVSPNVVPGPVPVPLS